MHKLKWDQEVTDPHWKSYRFIVGSRKKANETFFRRRHLDSNQTSENFFSIFQFVFDINMWKEEEHLTIHII